MNTALNDFSMLLMIQNQILLNPVCMWCVCRNREGGIDLILIGFIINPSYSP